MGHLDGLWIAPVSDGVILKEPSMQFGACPVCLTQIEEKRLAQGILVCQACGWSDNRHEQTLEEKTTRAIIRSYVVISLLLVAAFLQAVTWDLYFAEIVPLKAKQWSNMASRSDLERIVEICRERNNQSCVVNAYKDLVAQDPQDLELLGEYGQILAQNGKNHEAHQVFYKFFQAGGEDLNVAYAFAKILTDAGQFDEANKYFRYIIDSKPDTLQITVTHAYVDMLFKANRLDQAREVIESIRKKGDNTGYFMERELQQINQQLTAAR